MYNDSLEYFALLLFFFVEKSDQKLMQLYRYIWNTYCTVPVGKCLESRQYGINFSFKLVYTYSESFHGGILSNLFMHTKYEFVKTFLYYYNCL